MKKENTPKIAKNEQNSEAKKIVKMKIPKKNLFLKNLQKTQKNRFWVENIEF